LSDDPYKASMNKFNNYSRLPYPIIYVVVSSEHVSVIRLLLVYIILSNVDHSHSQVGIREYKACQYWDL